VGWLRSLLRQRANRTPSPPGSGGAAAARRREKEGEAAGCSSKREAPTGKPWASRTCQCPRLARGMVTFAATSARQSYTISAGQRRSRRCPAERKRKGRRPVVATNVRLPRASRGHPGPANAHGLPVGLLRSPLPPRSPAPLPNAHGLPVGWLRSLLRQRANCTPSPPGSGGAAAARRREREGGAAVCSDKREAPTGKPWASRPCQCPRLAVGTVTFAAPPPRCVNPSAFP